MATKKNQNKIEQNQESSNNKQTEQNRTERNTTEQNTTEHNETEQNSESGRGASSVIGRTLYGTARQTKSGEQAQFTDCRQLLISRRDRLRDTDRETDLDTQPHRHR